MLELIYETIFVEQDIVSLSLLVIFVILVVAIIIGVTAPKRKAKKGIADFKVDFTDLSILNQIVMQTNAKFYVRGEKAQDRLFKSKYQVGQDVVNSTGETFTISRIVKQPVANGMKVAYVYTVYFSQFEYSELPLEISVVKNKNVDIIKLDKDTIKLIKGEDVVYEKQWAECKFINLNFEIKFTDDGIKHLFHLTPKNFANNSDYSLLEEILIKYAHVL